MEIDGRPDKKFGQDFIEVSVAEEGSANQHQAPLLAPGGKQGSSGGSRAAPGGVTSVVCPPLWPVLSAGAEYPALLPTLQKCQLSFWSVYPVQNWLQLLTHTAGF